MRSRARTARLAAAAAVGLLALSGCALTPGVAAEVEGTEIPAGEVDRLTDAVCTVEGPTFQQPVPIAALKALVLQTLVDARLAEQVAEEYDVAPGPEVESQLELIAGQVANQPDDVADAYVEVLRGAQYAQAVFAGAAQAQLVADGGDPEDPAQSAGLGEDAEQIRLAAAEDAGIELSPRYGVTYADGAVQAAQGGSVPASDSALAAAGALTQQADPAYLESLPASQLCSG